MSLALNNNGVIKLDFPNQSKQDMVSWLKIYIPFLSLSLYIILVKIKRSLHNERSLYFLIYDVDTFF